MGRLPVKNRVMFAVEVLSPPTDNEDHLIEVAGQEELTEEEKEKRKEERDRVFVFRGAGLRPRKLHAKANKGDVYLLGDGERIIVKCDAAYMPFTAGGTVLASWLGDLAKDSKLAPLNIPTWDNPAFQEYQTDLLLLIESKFMYHSLMRGWVLDKLNARWRKHKQDLKKVYNDLISKDASPATILNKVPEGVDKQHWQYLVATWSTDKNRKQSEVNKENALKNQHPHTLGRRPISKLRNHIAEANGGLAPDVLTVFDASRKRKDGDYVNETSKEKMVEALDLKYSEMSANLNISSCEAGEKALKQVMGPHRRGRVPGVGLGGSSQQLALLRRSAQPTKESQKLAKITADFEKEKEKRKKQRKELKTLKERLKALEQRVLEN